MRPDLSDPAERAAYRRELRHYLRWWRLAGFLLIAAGVAAWLWAVYAEPELPRLRATGWALVGAGWLVFLAVIVARTRYHKARMAED